MLNRPERFKFEAAPYPIEPQLTSDLPDLTRFLFRNRYTILIAAALCLLLSAVYLAVAPVRYTARAQVIIDPNGYQSHSQSTPSETPLDTSTVESQVAVIKSGSIVNSVIRDLDLINDPEFSGTRVNALQKLLRYVFGEPPKQSPEQKFQLVIEQVQKALDVQRVGVSYVIDIEFRSQDRAKSARIANALAEAYRSSQADVTKESIRRANAWLEERLAIIREETLAAEKAVQDYKAQSKNLTSGATLLDLESQAQLQRRFYENFYQRYLETSQQLSYPVLEARIITPATPPLKKSEPRTIIILGVGVAFGVALGVATAFIRDRSIR